MTTETDDWTVLRRILRQGELWLCGPYH